MPNGPEERAWVFGDERNKRELHLQEYARVMTATDPNDFESLISSGADKEMMLHSWSFAPDGTILAVFVPGTLNALKRRAAEIAHNTK